MLLAHCQGSQEDRHTQSWILQASSCRELDTNGRITCGKIDRKSSNWAIWGVPQHSRDNFCKSQFRFHHPSRGVQLPLRSLSLWFLLQWDEFIQGLCRHCFSQISKLHFPSLVLFFVGIYHLKRGHSCHVGTNLSFFSFGLHQLLIELAVLEAFQFEWCSALGQVFQENCLVILKKRRKRLNCLCSKFTSFI